MDRIQAILPVEAYEGLFLISAGDSVDQILRSRETRVDRSIDTGDFASSLEKAETQSRFVVVESDEALTEILNAPLAQWRVFLHPMQKKLAIGNRSGPDAGFGRGRNGQDRVGHAPAKWLAENVTPDGQKVSFTTFTKNLAITLCGAETLKKIEVVTRTPGCMHTCAGSDTNTGSSSTVARKPRKLGSGH